MEHILVTPPSQPLPERRDFTHSHHYQIKHLQLLRPNLCHRVGRATLLTLFGTITDTLRQPTREHPVQGSSGDAVSPSHDAPMGSRLKLSTDCLLPRLLRKVRRGLWDMQPLSSELRLKNRDNCRCVRHRMRFVETGLLDNSPDNNSPELFRRVYISCAAHRRPLHLLEPKSSACVSRESPLPSCTVTGPGAGADRAG